MPSPLERHLIGRLRAARARLLRLASLPERLLSPRVRRLELPPLWLRRHAGPPAAFESSAREAVGQLERLGLLRDDLAILDLGCGPGALALALRGVLGDRGRYAGVDVHGPSVDWCARAFAADRRFEFRWLARRGSPYCEPSTSAPIRSLAELGGFDLVVAKSLATHLLPLELTRLLAEIARSLAVHGTLVLTAFAFDGAAGGEVPCFPHRSRRGRVRWRLQAHPRAAVAYDRPFLAALLRRSGLQETAFVPGFYPGTAAELHGQDTLVVRREPLATRR